MMAFLNEVKQSTAPKRALLYIAVLATLMPGCALMGPDYGRPKEVAPAMFSEDAAGDVAAAPVSKTWWELYQDPILNELIAKAHQNNTDIKLAVARVEESDAFLREVGAALFPQIDLDSTATRSKITQLGATPLFNGIQPIRENYNIRLGTSFELDFWGRLRRGKESARALALGTRFAKDTVELSLSGLVSSNYLLLRSLDAQLELTRDSLRSRQESLSLTQRRLDGGVASSLDVNQAQVAASNLDAQLADLIRQRAVVLHQLAVLTGDLNLQLAEGRIDSLPIPPIPPAGLPSSLLEARPDVRQAEQDLISANAKIGVAKAALFPTISLTAYYGGESAQLGDVLKSAARIWSGGLGLNLPIFDSGRLNARLDQATAVQKQTLASYEGAVQTAFREVNDALVSVRRNSEREAALQISRDASKRALDTAENRYKSGYSGYLDVLDSQRVYNDSALAFIQSRQARLVATVDLFKALGGGWSADQEVVSKR